MTAILLIGSCCVAKYSLKPVREIAIPPERRMAGRRLRCVRRRPAHRPHHVDARGAGRSTMVLVDHGAGAAAADRSRLLGQPRGGDSLFQGAVGRLINVRSCPITDNML